jgi:hypothetical protein
MYCHCLCMGSTPSSLLCCRGPYVMWPLPALFSHLSYIPKLNVLPLEWSLLPSCTLWCFFALHLHLWISLLRAIHPLSTNSINLGSVIICFRDVFQLPALVLGTPFLGIYNVLSIYFPLHLAHCVIIRCACVPENQDLGLIFSSLHQHRTKDILGLDKILLNKCKIYLALKSIFSQALLI